MYIGAPLTAEQWKWIGVTVLLFALCGILFWVGTESGLQLVANVRVWCRDLQDMLPASDPTIVRSRPAPAPQPQQLNAAPIALSHLMANRPELPLIPSLQQDDSDSPSLNVKGAVAASGELETKAALERLLGAPFEKIRPAWLRNPTGSGRNLEIDLYNSDLRIGVEYNGVQHYAFPNPYHKTLEEFAAQQLRDLHKRQICKGLGLLLIVVPFTVKRKNIEAFLRAELQQHNIACASPIAAA